MNSTGKTQPTLPAGRHARGFHTQNQGHGWVADYPNRSLCNEFVPTGAQENHIDAAMFRPNVPLYLPEPGGTLEQIPSAPSWLPLLFVTIACGAVSGFHSLVSSGTTVRQLNRETDAWPIGYGAMLIEGALAILVIIACTAALGSEHWHTGAYACWSGIKGGGLSAQLSAVVRGGAAGAKRRLSDRGSAAGHGRPVG